MMPDKQTLNDLVTAFAYRLSLDRTFYWKAATGKMIEVSFLDYSFFCEDKAEYESGLSKEEEWDVKEAIIAIEKNRGTHIRVPLLEKEERVSLMKAFVDKQRDSELKAILERNSNAIAKSSSIRELIQAGYTPGFELMDLTKGAHELDQEWREYYRSEIEKKVLNWLSSI